MIKYIQTCILQFSLILVFALGVAVSTNTSAAQTAAAKQKKQLQSLRSGIGILAFTGNLRWRNYYIGTSEGLKEESQIELQAEFRSIYMLSPHVGLGYRTFATVFMTGFFEGGGLGGVALGPIVRYYPLKSSRWQPYLQGNLLAGYNLALSDALGINDVGGIRYRSGLRGGLGYKFSNAFGMFFELGPSWEYSESLRLDSRAIQFNIGVELFRF